MKLLQRLLTKNLNEIPLFYVTFNYNKYKDNGKKGSCNAQVHPNIANDEHVKETLNDLIDYIRDNYNMDDI